MNNKEAIELIKPLMLSRINTSVAVEKRPIVYAFDMAIKALEKQIPKKPIRACYIFKNDGSWFAQDEEEFWKCPIDHVAYDVPLKEKQKFCHYCGQAIDWSQKDA